MNDISESKPARAGDLSTQDTLFHVTPVENWPRIQAEGLKPQIGPRSQLVDETTPAVYLFPTMMDLDDALMQWLGDEMPACDLAILEIAGADLMLERTAGYELRTLHLIPAEAIRLIRIEEYEE